MESNPKEQKVTQKNDTARQDKSANSKEPNSRKAEAIVELEEFERTTDYRRAEETGSRSPLGKETQHPRISQECCKFAHSVS